MYIGSCRGCKQYCQESKKHIYEDNHLLQKHLIIDSRAFRDDNSDILRKSKKAWESYDKTLSNFFKNLRFQINEIEKAAYAELEDEEIKTAINSNDKFMVKVAKDIFAEKYADLQCDEIDEFIELTSVHESKQLGKIEKQESVLVDRLLKDIDTAVRHCTEALKKRGKNSKEETTPKGKTNRKEDRYQEPKEEKKQGKREERPAGKRESEKIKEPKKEEKEYEQKKEKAIPPKIQQPKLTKQVEKTIPKLQIIDLKSNDDDFSIDVKLINQVKRLGEKELWRVNDQTGESKLIIFPHDILKPGLKISLNHCFTKLHVESIQIHTKYNYTLTTSQNGEIIVLQAKDYAKQPKKTYVREQRPKNASTMIKIDDIDPEKQNLILVAQIIKPELIDGITYCVLGDDTGIVNAKFNVPSPLLKQGQTIYVRSLEPVVNQKGNIVLESAKNVIIEAARTTIRRVNQKNNISLRVYQEVDELPSK